MNSDSCYQVPRNTSVLRNRSRPSYDHVRCTALQFDVRWDLQFSTLLILQKNLHKICKNFFREKTSVEIGRQVCLVVTSGRFAHRRMTVTEARRATKLVCLVEQKMSRDAPLAKLKLTWAHCRRTKYEYLSHFLPSTYFLHEQTPVSGRQWGSLYKLPASSQPQCL